MRSPLTQAPEPPKVAQTRARERFFASSSRELRWSLDRERRLMVVEGAWQSVLGWQPEQVRGWYWEEIVHPGDHARLNDVFKRLRAGSGCEQDIDLRLALAPGGHRLTSWTFALGSGDDSIIGLGHDRTHPPVPSPEHALLADRRNAQLTARLGELEERYGAVERFAATAAHQLAEPLVIAESSAILVAEELGPELEPVLRERLDAIGRSAARARRLMDALLEDSRAATAPLERCTVDLAEVVDDAVGSLKTRIEARRATVKVGQLPRVLADHKLLAVVLDNLLLNAVKHGPRDGGVVSIDADPTPTGWRISVASGGPPIADADVERIFEPFRRLPGERRIGGHGLGLTICTRLVERLGGTLGLDPGVHSGNTFWIELPAAA